LTVAARVVAALARAADVPVESLARDARLATLGIGSLEQIECILALEDELQLELGEPDLRSLRTVQDVIDAVERAVADAGRAAPKR
jgi:acyl carrier protein